MQLQDASQVRPNQHAEPLTVVRLADGFRIGGYQAFEIHGRNPVALRTDAKLRRKQSLILPYFCPQVLQNRTVLDVGGNAGYFGFLALSRGAVSVDSIDVDSDYVEAADRIAQEQGVRNFHAHFATLNDWHTPADITLAFAMVHWLYSSTTGWGSLDEVIAQLADRTRVLLLIEWVAPSDPAITFFEHTTRHAKNVTGPYTFEAFERALCSHFSVVEPLGFVSPTRRLFAAWKSPVAKRLDMSCPMPKLFSESKLLSSSRVAVDSDGVEYWSRVYDLGDRIVKQAQRRQISVEIAAMKRLAGTGFVPELLGSSELGGYQHFEMERINGHRPEDARQLFREDAFRFVRQAVDILLALKKAGIVHRDISPSNLMVRSSLSGPQLVLLDFGWAVLHSGQRESEETWIPAGLGGIYRRPTGDFSDTYSMGLVLKEMVGGIDSRLDRIFSLMAPVDSQLKPVEPELVSEILATLM